MKGKWQKGQERGRVSVWICVYTASSACVCLCAYMLQSSPYGQTHTMMLSLLAFASDSNAFFFKNRYVFGTQVDAGIKSSVET